MRTETRSDTHVQKACYRTWIDKRQKWKQGVLVRDFSVYPEGDGGCLESGGWGGKR